MSWRCQTYAQVSWGMDEREQCTAYAERVSLTVPVSPDAPYPTQTVTTALCPLHLEEWQSREPRTDGRRLVLLPRTGDLCLVWTYPEPWERDAELALKLR